MPTCFKTDSLRCSSDHNSLALKAGVLIPSRLPGEARGNDSGEHTNCEEVEDGKARGEIVQCVAGEDKDRADEPEQKCTHLNELEQQRKLSLHGHGVARSVGLIEVHCPGRYKKYLAERGLSASQLLRR